MRIDRLRIRDLQRHADLDLPLAPGITVVRGPNEAGKTTIQRAIELALFRRVTSGSAEMETLRRWDGPGGVPTIELEYTDAEGQPGSLLKAFDGARGRARLEAGGEVIDDPATVDQRLVELTGLPSDKFFHSTASVHHHELDKLAKDESALRDRLQASMSVDARGTSKARKMLRDALHGYEAGGSKNPGKLLQARDEIQRLEAQNTLGEAGLRQLAADQAAQSAARTAHTEAEDRLAEARQQLALSDQAVELLRRQDDATGRYGRYKRAAELRDELLARDAAHPSTIPLETLQLAVEELRRHEQRIGELRAALADEPDVSGYDLGALPTPRWRRWATVGIVLALVGVLVALGGTVAKLGLGAGAVGLIAAAVGLVLAAVADRQRRRSQDLHRQNELRESEIARRLAGRSQLEQQLKDTEQGKTTRLEALELPDVLSAEALLAAESEHMAAMRALAAEYRGVLGDEQPTDDVAKLRDAAAAEAEQARHALAGMGPIGADPAGSRERYGRAAATGQQERDRTQQDLARAQAAVEQNPVDAEAVAASAEQLAAAREHLAATERRARILRTTLEALDAAEEATMRKAARFLEGWMGGYVDRITNGRYRRVRVDEAELGISVWSPERDDWVPAEQLSQGTRDALYLAARLGLVRQVTQDRRPPLIFDDPFLTLDDERAREAVGLLREIAADHQVIYLTTSERYDADADLVHVLPGPPGRDVAEQAAGD
ncbi:MAG TPA: AAA family ATPase [Candidatus Limnocylindrales bacterium]|nr:AAA family ATPase [Candidatus Limnocylindrales bacterium]